MMVGNLKKTGDPRSGCPPADPCGSCGISCHTPRRGVCLVGDAPELLQAQFIVQDIHTCVDPAPTTVEATTQVPCPGKESKGQEKKRVVFYPDGWREEISTVRYFCHLSGCDKEA